MSNKTFSRMEKWVNEKTADQVNEVADVGIDEKTLVSIRALIAGEIDKTAASVMQRIAKQEYERRERQKEADRLARPSPDKRFQNTKLLMQNYRMFKKAATDAIFDASALCDDGTEFYKMLMSTRCDEVKIESIQDTAERTGLIMAHVERAVANYEDYCRKSTRPEDERNCRMIIDFYVREDMITAAELADRENLSVRGVYTGIDVGLTLLANFVFGIDGTKFV